jgi:hypothetical protein
MKKFFGILFIAGALVACNDSSKTEETSTDTTTTVETTPPPPPVMVDTTVKTDTTVGVTVDTTKK